MDSRCFRGVHHDCPRPIDPSHIRSVALGMALVAMMAMMALGMALVMALGMALVMAMCVN